MQLPLKRSSARIFSQKKQIDFLILGIVILLSMFGLLMVYDASQFEAFQYFGDKYYFFRSQIMWMIIGFSFLFFFIFFDYHRLQKIALPFFIFSLILLFSVFIPGLGISAGGAHRWLKIFSLTLQPVEVVKLSTIIFFAFLFQKKTSFIPFLLLLGLIEIVIGIFQRDLGSGIIFGFIAVGIYFIAEAPVVHFLGLLLTGFIGFIGFILVAPYRKQRILAFLDPFTDPQGFSYHISQVLIALGSGGLFGVGIGQSRQKFAYIPEVTTDSIFSIIGEEFGLFGSFIFLSLTIFLILRCFKIIETAPDNFGKLLSAGLAIWLGFQIIINLAAMVSLVPLTGVPLPFVSYGGSALLANLVAVGILLNISKQANIKT